MLEEGAYAQRVAVPEVVQRCPQHPRVRNLLLRGVRLCAMLDQVLSTQISVRARSLGRLSGHRVVSRKLHQLLVGDVPSWAARHRPLEESHKLLRVDVSVERLHDAHEARQRHNLFNLRALADVAENLLEHSHVDAHQQIRDSFRSKVGVDDLVSRLERIVDGLRLYDRLQAALRLFRSNRLSPRRHTRPGYALNKRKRDPHHTVVLVWSEPGAEFLHDPQVDPKGPCRPSHVDACVLSQDPAPRVLISVVTHTVDQVSNMHGRVVDAAVLGQEELPDEPAYFVVAAVFKIVDAHVNDTRPMQRRHFCKPHFPDPLGRRP
mmetsp:Transcript_10692/g.25204  ORF Transcript_10692/g.25204 Transcript_10692/m.25204 type:complete len:320 (+) Transcript_10692:800-1759(+)